MVSPVYVENLSITSVTIAKCASLNKHKGVKHFLKRFLGGELSSTVMYELPRKITRNYAEAIWSFKIQSSVKLDILKPNTNDVA